MYCGRCGCKIETEGRFCPECGSEVDSMLTDESTQRVTSGKQTGKSANLVKLIAIIACVVIAVIAIIIVAFGGNGYKTTIANYFKAIETQNYKLLYNVYADYWQREYVKFTGSENYLREVFEDDVEDELYDLHCGDQVKIKYKIYKVRKLPTDLRNKLIDDIYDSIGIAELFNHERDNIYRSIKDAAIVYVSYNVTGNNGYDSYDYRYLLIKENGKWRMVRGLYGSINKYDPDY